MAFVGTANVNPGLGYPVLGAARTGSWNFTVDTGVGVRAGTGEVGLATGGAAGDLGVGTVQATVGGPLGGGAFCGASGGFGGSGGISFGSTTYTFGAGNPIGWQQSAGSLILFTDANGAIPGANVIGLVIAIPPTPATGVGSCLSGTATQFTIVGAAVALA